MTTIHRTRRSSTRIALDEGERARLLAIYEVCVACELAAIVAAEHLAQRGVPSRDLLACASICGATAAQLAALRTPDVEAVREVLVACAAACARARAACEEAGDDAVALRCVSECARCEARCADVGAIELAA